MAVDGQWDGDDPNGVGGLLEDWMRAIRHAVVAKAIDYMLARWEALYPIPICLSNSAAERPGLRTRVNGIYELRKG